MSFLDFDLQPGKSNFFRWLLLKSLSLIYTSLIRVWLFLYKSGLKSGYTSTQKVISIGNITVGGTGKTPMISWLLDYLHEEKLEPIVLTRGYKSDNNKPIQILKASTAESEEQKRFGDEPWLLFKRHPWCSIYISPNRAFSARAAEKLTNLLLLDDGMQHLKLNRDLNIVLIDSLSGIGNGQVIPLGPLREPLKGLQRADIIVYTRTNLASSHAVKERLQPYLKPCTPQFDSCFIPEKIVASATEQESDPQIIANKKCLLFSGIGNPPSFEKIVQELGGIVTDHLILDDHCEYREDTLEKLIRFSAQAHYDYIICTEKDWVKLEPIKDRLFDFWFLKMELKSDPALKGTILKFLEEGIEDR
jgi:tetraacyldisaccharide 4'-kinase